MKKSILEKLEKFKYPLLVLALGVAVMLIPSGSPKQYEQGDGAALQQILSAAEGVGEAKVIVSEDGVVVVSRGADDPRVRLEIIEAVCSYTGFGSDKITVLKMAD